MSIRSKFFLTFGFLICCILFLTILALLTTDGLKKNVDAIIYGQYSKGQPVSKIENDADTIAEGTRNIVLAKEPEIRQQESARITAAEDSLVDDIHSLELTIVDAQGIMKITELKQSGADYVEYSQKVLKLVGDGKEEEAAVLIVGDGIRLESELFEHLDDLQQLNRQEMDASAQSSEQLYDDTFGILLVFPFFILVLGLVVTFFFSRNITRNLRKVSTVMDRFTTSGNHSSDRLYLRSKDEIGLVAQSFNRMADALYEKQEQERELLQSNKEQIWLLSNLSAVSGVIQSSDTIPEMCNYLFQEIGPLLDICCGAIYVEDSEDTPYSRYSLGGVYAVPDAERHKLKPFVEAGDGIIGQVLSSGIRRVLSDIPAEEIRFSTGLADLKSASLYIVPFLNDKKVEAVLELAAPHKFTVIQERFLEQLGIVVSLTIRKLINQNRIRQLLFESQKQTEELQQFSEELASQQEELMQTNAEMEEQTAALEHSEDLMRIQQAELEQVNADLKERAQQLIAASSYKSEFLANMSHELRTPLNSMLILTKLLVENRGGNLTAKQIEYAQTVYSSSTDLLALINQILDLASVESGKIQINIDTIQKDGLEKFVNRNFGPVSQQKGLKLVVDVGSDVPAYFRSDILRLQQILHNLLSNAFKFTKSGTITFSVRRVDVEDSPPLLAISVSDTGIGIPLDMQEVIFDAFVQVDGTTSRNYGGTGLGLSIVRELAHLLGGEIAVSSRVGVGSVFTLTIPLEEVAEADGAAIDKSPSQLVLRARSDDSEKETITEVQKYSFAGQTVLIIDDDIRNAFALSSRLETYEIKVLYADSGMQGIELLKKHHEIELVLMDVMMPEMDGYEATRKIREMPQYAKLPIIIVSAKAREEDRNHGLNAGASDYLTKPVEADKLLSLMKLWLRTNS